MIRRAGRQASLICAGDAPVGNHACRMPLLWAANSRQPSPKRSRKSSHSPRAATGIHLCRLSAQIRFSGCATYPDPVRYRLSFLSRFVVLNLADKALPALNAPPDFCLRRLNSSSAAVVGYLLDHYSPSPFPAPALVTRIGLFYLVGDGPESTALLGPG